MKTICIIPCRKGSKRVPNKNFKEMCGKPLFAWSLECIQACNFIDEILISTNYPEIVEYTNNHYSRNERIQLIERPETLAQDSTSMEEVIEHALNLTNNNKGNIIKILAQPTSPLRIPLDVERSYTLYNAMTHECSLVSGNWYGKQFVLNGAIYIWNSLPLIRDQMVLYEMPLERSIDVDLPSDWEEAEGLLIERELEKVNTNQEVVK